MIGQDPGRQVGGVIDRGIVLFKAAFAAVLVLAFASALVRSLPHFYPTWTEVLLSSGVLTNTVAEPDEMLGALGDSLIPMVLTWPVGIFLSFGVMLQIGSAANGATMGWQTALGLAWRRITPLVGCLIAYVLAFVVTFGVALFVGGAVMRTLVFDLPADQVGVVAGLIGMAAALVAAIPLTALFVYWCLALPLVATENLNAFSALRRSWRLVRGNFWQALVVVSVAGFVVFAVASLVGIAGMLLVAGTQGGPVVRATVVLLNAAAATVTTPFFLATLLAMVEYLSPRRA